MVEMVTLGLVTNRLITRDQINMLATDNTVSAGAKGLADLGIEPTPMEGILPEYLWRFRPSGQFAAIKASAKNLKKA
jgi:NADH dehydrogenase